MQKNFTKDGLTGNGDYINVSDLRALLDKAEVSEPDISYYGILDTGTVIDVNDTYDESNNRLKSLIEHDKDYESATIIPLYTSQQPSRIAELEAEIARLKAITLMLLKSPS